MITSFTFKHGWVLGMLAFAAPALADSFNLQLRSQRRVGSEGAAFERIVQGEKWAADKTAVIVCDVWDLHHCRNAVRRLEEFAPRLNQVLVEARRRGATIIHSPSDCMEAYADHPARRRAISVPRATAPPKDIDFWCSRIPREEQAQYPIDQSDGGEDDDPAEHAQWSAKLTALGRNPNMPWKKQSALIVIDDERDYISDRGDEVWNILERRGILHVILTGVHCNMCVLGRPFGLRQMVRNGKQVVLMRDMTDSMYNPNRWPYVDHFTGNDLVISHVERFVCPTITSDQVLGGEPFRWKSDLRAKRDVADVESRPRPDRTAFEKHWSRISVPSSWEASSGGVLQDYSGVAWYRSAVRIPQSLLDQQRLVLSVPPGTGGIRAWVNGHACEAHTNNALAVVRFDLRSEWITPNDVNLIVLRVVHASGDGGLGQAPTISAGKELRLLQGHWQFRLGDDPSFSNMPLPARFGSSTDIVFEL